MNYLELLKSRASTRKFTEKQITEKELSDILLAANSAPVGSNLYKDIHLTVVQNKEILNKLSEAAVKRSEDKKRMKQISGDVKLDDMSDMSTDIETPAKPHSPFYSAPTVIFVSHRNQDVQPGIEFSNVACIVLSMHLAATDLGLGSVFMWHILESMREIPELDNSYLLNFPEGFSPLLGIALGYPEKPLKTRELRADKIKTDYM
ncbi:nitroreductase [Treponema primitia ZAS-2]|uniref:Nitroreductase n=1 Tax=Treponema primitia (strain ATCC BAA-887 / DSM 12427 / ZAS-2) TaxID=545694 RepID=F5YJE3_TREPZ|nr:nitroreductase family protein [Treponema primitia]AEF84034.1 nitroreductase [Treponema primitia ZAS-2]